MSKDMLGPLPRALAHVPTSRHGIILDVTQKLSENAQNADAFATDLKSFVRNWRKSVIQEDPILVLISEGENLVLGPLDGSRTIAGAKNVFRAYLDSDFRNWSLDVRAPATEETRARVYEMCEDGTYADIFGSFARPLSELCFTQDQIVEFCVKYPDRLRQDGFATFFLFKVNDEFFVARVYGYPLGLNVHAYRFGHSSVWLGGYRPHVVVPQQELGV